jgi:hypothetical protein
MTTLLSKRKPNDKKSHHASEPLSTQTGSTILQSNVQNHSDDKLKITRIMSISRKTINQTTENKDSNSQQEHKRHYVMNQLSDFQSKTHMMHTGNLTIDSSSPISTNPINCKHKNNLSVVQSKFTRHQKRVRKNQICSRPSWVSSYKNPTTNKPIKQTSFSLKQLRDPCQVLQLYTQFKRTNCIPYECVCAPLPPCCDISSCSFIKNAHICNMYLTK